jgi:hypothetical protein
MSKVIDKISSIAAEALARHEVSQVVTGSTRLQQWCVARPGTSAYAFTITTIPDQALLMITGDLGCAAWQRETDMVAWARGAVKDIDYFAGKLTMIDKPARRWSEETTRDVITSAIEDATGVVKTQLRHIVIGLDVGEPWDPGHVKQLMFDSGHWDGCDFPDTSDWDEQFVWKWCCVRRWLELI